MNIIALLIKYICSIYPHPNELSNARLTKIIYLTDWEFFRETGEQITDIQWYFDNYGPFVHDVYETANRDPEIEIMSTQTIYGTSKTIFHYAGETPVLDNALIKDCLDKVIRETQSMYWNEFIDYVYQTPPIVNSHRYTLLNFKNFKESTD